MQYPICMQLLDGYIRNVYTHACAGALFYFSTVSAAYDQANDKVSVYQSTHTQLDLNHKLNHYHKVH